MHRPSDYPLVRVDRAWEGAVARRETRRGVDGKAHSEGAQAKNVTDGGTKQLQVTSVLKGLCEVTNGGEGASP